MTKTTLRLGFSAPERLKVPCVLTFKSAQGKTSARIYLSRPTATNLMRVGLLTQPSHRPFNGAISPRFATCELDYKAKKRNVIRFVFDSCDAQSWKGKLHYWDANGRYNSAPVTVRRGDLLDIVQPVHGFDRFDNGWASRFYMLEEVA